VEEPAFEEYQIFPEKKIELSVKRTQEPLSSILRSKKKKKRKVETSSVSTVSTVLYPLSPRWGLLSLFKNTNLY
jgi:hypothetical protein